MLVYALRTGTCPGPGMVGPKEVQFLAHLHRAQGHVGLSRPCRYLHVGHHHSELARGCPTAEDNEKKCRLLVKVKEEVCFGGSLMRLQAQ